MTTRCLSFVFSIVETSRVNSVTRVSYRREYQCGKKRCEKGFDASYLDGKWVVLVTSAKSRGRNHVRRRFRLSIVEDMSRMG